MLAATHTPAAPLSHLATAALPMGGWQELLPRPKPPRLCHNGICGLRPGCFASLLQKSMGFWSGKKTKCKPRMAVGVSARAAPCRGGCAIFGKNVSIYLW